MTWRRLSRHIRGNDHAQRNLRLDQRRPRSRARASARLCAEQSAAGSCVGRRHPKDRGRHRVERCPDAAQKHPKSAKSAGDLRACAPRAHEPAPLVSRAVELSLARRRNGRAIAFGRPGYDVSLSNHRLKEMDRRLGGRRLIEEFDHQRQIDINSQHVVRVNLAIGAKPGDAPEDGHSFHGVSVVQSREDLAHQGCAPPAIPFAQINSNHEDLSRHHLLRLTNFARGRRRRTPHRIR